MLLKVMHVFRSLVMCIILMASCVYVQQACKYRNNKIQWTIGNMFILMKKQLYKENIILTLRYTIYIPRWILNFLECMWNNPTWQCFIHIHVWTWDGYLSYISILCHIGRMYVTSPHRNVYMPTHMMYL